ncbi:hypothetical protein HG530_007904 [Fusarium avenaceum]|nr:hypothetical protein HG530_007904 [Fusarium avenaceum]
MTTVLEHNEAVLSTTLKDQTHIRDRVNGPELALDNFGVFQKDLYPTTLFAHTFSNCVQWGDEFGMTDYARTATLVEGAHLIRHGGVFIIEIDGSDGRVWCSVSEYTDIGLILQRQGAVGILEQHSGSGT